MLTCYAIDDEISALEILNDYISLNQNLSLLKTFTNPVNALDYITKNHIVDVIFIDIEMPQLNGVELAKLVMHKARNIVFVTAHTKYAYEAIELETKFLLKPYSFAKFNALLNKILNSNILAANVKPDFFLVKKPGDRATKIKVKFKEVIFIESQLRHTKIQTIHEQIISDQSFAKIKALFTDESDFIQTHRSFIVSTKRIKVVGNENIVLESNFKVPIGRNYKNQFLKSVRKK